MCKTKSYRSGSVTVAAAQHWRVFRPRDTLLLAGLTAASALPLFPADLAAAATDTWTLPAATDGSVSKWSDPSGWSLGTVPAPADDALIQSGAACDENVGGNTYINNVTVQNTATLQVHADNSGGITNYNVFFYIGGTVQNDGAISIAGGGGRTSDVIFTNSSASLTGSGTLTLASPASVLLSTAAAPALTVGEGQTINGVGYISADLVNQGTINANVGGEYTSPLVLVANAYNYDTNITTSTANYTNEATMEATAGGNLQIGDGDAITLNNTGGTIEATGTSGIYGSAVNIENGVTVNGGTMSSDGIQSTYSDYVNVSGTVTLNGVTLTSGTVLQNPNTLVLKGILNINGDVENTRGISLTGGNNATLVGDGGIHMNNAGSSITTDSSTSLTNNAIIHGLGNISGTIINGGTINADSNNILNFTTTAANPTTSITNTGTIEATNSSGQIGFGYNANFSGSSALTVNNVGGTIAADGGLVEFEWNTTVTGGNLSTSNGGDIHVDNYTTTFNNVTLTSDSTLSNGRAINLEGTITDNGSIENGNASISVIDVNNATLAGSGSMNMDSSGSTLTTDNSSSLTNDITIAGLGTISGRVINNGTIRSDSNNSINFNIGLLTNNGILAVTNNSSINIGSASDLSNYSAGTLTGGTYRVDGGSALNISGAAITTNAATIILNGNNATFNAISGLTANTGTFELENGATFNFVGNFNNSGTLSMDPSSARVVGNLVLTSSSVLDIGLTGTGTGQYDTINVDGSAALAGQLVINLESGFTAKTGDTFNFLTAAGGVTGSFANSGPLNADGYTFDLTATGGNSLGLEVAAVPTPEPAALALFAIASVGMLLLRKRRNI
jgi:hypothetical protein